MWSSDLRLGEFLPFVHNQFGWELVKSSNPLEMVLQTLLPCWALIALFVRFFSLCDTSLASRRWKSINPISVKWTAHPRDSGNIWSFLSIKDQVWSFFVSFMFSIWFYIVTFCLFIVIYHNYLLLFSNVFCVILSCFFIFDTILFPFALKSVTNTNKAELSETRSLNKVMKQCRVWKVSCSAVCKHVMLNLFKIFLKCFSFPTFDFADIQNHQRSIHFPDLLTLDNTFLRLQFWDVTPLSLKQISTWALHMCSHTHAFVVVLKRSQRRHQKCQETVKLNGVLRGWKPKLWTAVSSPGKVRHKRWCTLKQVRRHVVLGFTNFSSVALMAPSNQWLWRRNKDVFSSFENTKEDI